MFSPLFPSCVFVYSRSSRRSKVQNMRHLLRSPPIGPPTPPRKPLVNHPLLSESRNHVWYVWILQNVSVILQHQKQRYYRVEICRDRNCTILRFFVPKTTQIWDKQPHQPGLMMIVLILENISAYEPCKGTLMLICKEVIFFDCQIFSTLCFKSRVKPHYLLVWTISVLIDLNLHSSNR